MKYYNFAVNFVTFIFVINILYVIHFLLKDKFLCICIYKKYFEVKIEIDRILEHFVSISSRKVSCRFVLNLTTNLTSSRSLEKSCEALECCQYKKLILSILRESVQPIFLKLQPLSQNLMIYSSQIEFWAFKARIGLIMPKLT